MMKILIVDDDSNGLYMLEVMLKGSGYEVASAANGAEALEKLNAEEFDVIVADILMPVMDGFQLCRKVKGNKDLNHILFIFYTATHTEEKDEELALQMGADKFIRKPVEPDEFIKIIQGVIGDMEKGKGKPKKADLEEEKEVFNLYSESLVKKLEKKMLDLEREINQRKLAEEERKKLEEELRQAQKMEAIGTLAGGVAHDFNNILTIIIGNADLALKNVVKDDPLREDLGEIKIAAERAASLTRQLLAFSRKQIITPRVLDLNELLTDIEKKMLSRLVGEDVELLTIPEPALWQVQVDPGQMEQVIMNLAINARDAMPTGGKLTIETANIDLAENYFYNHGIKKQPGPYVMLAVSDTGSGMDEKIKEHIFDPFFTTKVQGKGKGTGLGLSTVYGIVKQNNGFVWVYSEPDQGTTFKVYLPKVEGDADSEEKQRTPVVELGGSETVLIVEDDDSLRKLARNALQQHEYRVLDAENGEDALRVSQEHEGPIDLMITDVVMPKMGGKEAADRLRPLYPQMKVIYMSGYTDNAIVHHGVLAPGLNFIEKPFSPEGLAHKVREVLDQEDLEQ
jgi:signal transduction histidine kinase